MTKHLGDKLSGGKIQQKKYPGEKKKTLEVQTTHKKIHLWENVHELAKTSRGENVHWNKCQRTMYSETIIIRP